MLQLILAVLGLALLTLAWLPHLQMPAVAQQRSDVAATVLPRALPRFQKAYQLLTEQGEGVPPSSSLSAEAVYGPVLRLMPAAPEGFVWVYGRQTNEGSSYTGRDYICALSQAPKDGQRAGLIRAQALLAESDVEVGHVCGSNSSASGQAQERVALTFYLRYDAPEPSPEEAPVEGEPPPDAPSSGEPE